MRHIKGIDGLRGIAIISVLIYHFIRFSPENEIQKIFKGITDIGYMGVDLFFVLSGFLIGGILFENMRSKKDYYFFVMRRVLRIFPAYFFLLAILFFSSYFFIEVPYQKSVDNQWYFWMYLSNWYIGLNGFDSAPWLTHTWSLSIEEQFYLLFPLFIPLLNKFWKFGLIVFTIIIIRFFLYDFGFRTLNYTGIFSRMDSLIIGASFAFLSIKKIKIGNTWLIITSIIFLIIGYYTQFSPRSFYMQFVGFSISSLFFGTLIISIINNEKVSSLIDNRLFKFFGKYSYGMYLFHVPILKAIELFVYDDEKIKFGSSLIFFITICLTSTVIMALVSWHIIEIPFLRLKRYFSYK